MQRPFARSAQPGGDGTARSSVWVTHVRRGELLALVKGLVAGPLPAREVTSSRTRALRRAQRSTPRPHVEADEVSQG
jgi:hypothetical protein